MNKLTTLQSNYQQAITELPWQDHQITLLLDGINTPEILQLLYANNAIKQFEVLYIQTRFAELKDVSPCLISLPNTQSYPIQKFIENLQDEWGYLLVSKQSWQAQINHLRELLVIKDLEQQSILLKLADPLVMTALLQQAIQQQNSQLFGPFSQVITYDILENNIHNLKRPEGDITKPLNLPYQLNEKETALLDQVDIKRANQHIYGHMQAYFPEFVSRYGNDYKKEIDVMINLAEQLGYTSVKAQLYYLNIHGYMGVNALQENEQLFNLVKVKNIESLKEAAQLAKQIFDNKGI